MWRSALVGLFVALAACGGGNGAGTAQPESPSAPDFALELGGGGTFVLSEEARPVFMVFWAEW